MVEDCQESLPIPGQPTAERHVVARVVRPEQRIRGSRQVDEGAQLAEQRPDVGQFEATDCI